MKGTFAIFHQRGQTHKPTRCAFCTGADTLENYLFETEQASAIKEARLIAERKYLREERVRLEREEQERLEREAQWLDRMQLKEALLKTNLDFKERWAVYICRNLSGAADELTSRVSLDSKEHIGLSGAVSRAMKNRVPFTVEELNIVYQMLMDSDHKTLFQDYGLEDSGAGGVVMDAWLRIRQTRRDAGDTGKLPPCVVFTKRGCDYEDGRAWTWGVGDTLEIDGSGRASRDK